MAIRTASASPEAINSELDTNPRAGKFVPIADRREAAVGDLASSNCVCVELPHIPESDDAQPKILHGAPLNADYVDYLAWGVNRSCLVAQLQ